MFKNLLLATDFSEESKRLISAGPALWSMQPVKVTLLHVVPPSTSVVIPGIAGGMGAVPLITELQLQAEESAHTSAMAELSKFMADMNAPLPVSLSVRTGSATSEICAVATEEKCDLIVMSSHGHGLMHRLLLGSTAQHVVNNAPCAVLILRSQQQS